jgi:hypothetical protein
MFPPIECEFPSESDFGVNYGAIILNKAGGLGWFTPGVHGMVRAWKHPAVKATVGMGG